jgi:hypothetical protein
MAGTIIKGEEHFFVTTYEGNGGGQRVGKFVPFTDNGTIAKSCTFNSPDSPVLSRTPSGSGTSKKTFTISAWIKRGRHINSSSDHSMTIFGVNHGSSARYSIFGLYNGGSGNPNQLRLFLGKYTTGSSTSGYDWITNRTLEDTSKWYHLMAVVDTTDATAGDRVKMYIDGERVTSFSSSSNPSLNDEFYFGSEKNNYVSTYNGSFGDWDGYMAEVNFVDGSALTPDTFGLTDTSTGRWIPKSLTGITYGTNGFRLEFANTAGQTIGDDTSGNTNDFTVNNLAASDITTDSPTQNHATLQGTGGTISEGNLKLVTGNSEQGHHNATLKPKSGKYYAEFTCNAMGRSEVGVVSNLLVPYGSNTTRMPTPPDGSIPGLMYYGYNGKVYNDSGNGTAATFNTYTTNDIIGIALDLDNLTVQFFKNNSSEGTIPIPTSNYIFAMGDGATGYGGGWTANFGQKSFSYTPPSGFVALQQDNLPETDKGIPDLMQIKNRDAADRWCWQDTTRGFGEYGSSASASPGSPVQFNSAITDGAQKSLKGGFAVEDSDYVNSASESYVSFNWVANNGVTATDTSGDLSTELQANPTAGFSIAKFTVSGSGVVTWAHGLGAVPEFGHLWTHNTTTYGTFYHHKMHATPAQKYMFLSSSQAVNGFTNGWGTSGPSSSLWSGTVGQLFSAGNTYMFYSYVGIPGYSKFDSYVGNGNADGPFVYLGFKPRYIWIKNTGATSNYAFDTLRFPNNPNGENVVYDGAYSEASTGNESLDFLSNGFKIRTTSSGTNTSGTTYIYGAFAEHPFNGDGENAFATAR